jgi:hypothetical protein
MPVWTEAHVRRLFWRAGFGATPLQASHWAAAGQAATLRWLLSGGSDRLVGAEPRVDGKPLDPLNTWSHDALWWLDRMVRSQRPLVEKLTLFWHDHFATSDQDTLLMLAQNRLLRVHSFGSFRTLLGKVARAAAAAVPVADRQRQGRAERELRARVDGALHARLGLHGDRHP